MINTIAPVILIVASIWLFFGYTNPTYTEITANPERQNRSVAELRTERAEYVQALETVKEIETVRESLLTRYNSLKPEDKEKILKLLPDHIDSVRLIIDINNIASQYGMSLSKISVSAPDDKAASKASAPTSPDQVAPGAPSVGPDSNLYGSVKLGFSVAGPYRSFLQFMDKLQSSLRLVDITSLSFSSAPGSSAATSADPSGKAVTPDYYEYTVAIQTYYLR